MYVYAGQLKAFQYEKASAQLKWPADLPRGLVGFIGMCELAGGIGLVAPMAFGVLPGLTPLAALGLTVIMLLATAFHVRRRTYNALPLTLGLCAAAAFVAYGRWALLGQS
jgi:hypothetical protein